MTDKMKHGVGGVIQVVQLLASIGMVVFLAGAWRGTADATQMATSTQIQQLTRQIEQLKAEVGQYAEENRRLHAALEEHFVTRREWLLLVDRGGRPTLR